MRVLDGAREAQGWPVALQVTGPAAPHTAELSFSSELGQRQVLQDVLTFVSLMAAAQNF